MPTYKCPSCDFPPTKWGKLLKHLHQTGHAKEIKYKQTAFVVRESIVAKPTKSTTSTPKKSNKQTSATAIATVNEIVWLLQNYGYLNAGTIPSIFQQNFGRKLIWPLQFPDLLSWLSNIPGIVLENGPTLGTWPFVSYNNNAIGVQSYPSPPPVAHAPISGSLKSAGLDMKLLPGEAYDGVQQSYEDMAAESEVQS